jgi:hypothetical protein
LSYLSRIDKLNISEVQITGNKIIETKLIKDTIEAEITGHYLWIFPKTNIFFYPKDRIDGTLHKEFKRFKDIKLSIKGRKVLEVAVTERIPKYTWCGTLPPEPDNNETCYFTDETGYIFDEAPYFSGEVYFKFYGKVDGIENNPSGFYFFEQYFHKLVIFKETLNSMNLKPASIYVGDNGEIKIILSPASTTSTIPEILYKVESDLEILVENLQTALTTEPLQSGLKNKYSSLLYIDLRFGNRVYYKFQ